MSINTGDIWRFMTTSYSFANLSNPMLNMFWFEIETASPDMQAVAPANFDPIMEAFIEKYIEPLLPAQTATWEWSSILATNWSDPVRQFYNYTDVALTGTSPSSAYMPPWLTYSFRLNRGNSGTRNGQKRFGGIPEEAQNGGEAVMPYLGYLQSYAIGYEVGLDVVTADGAVSLLPVIVRLDAETNDVVVTQRVQSASYVRISSQDTRKR